LNVVCDAQYKSDKARAFKGVRGTDVGVNLMIVDIPKGLPVSMVSSPPTSVLGWNSVDKNFLPMVFDFGSSLAYDNGALLLFHKDDLKLRVNIRGFAKAYHFSILKEWTGINRLPITNARDASKTVSGSSIVICFILVNGQKRYILVATKYVTKWAEALATKTGNAKTVAKFLYENIIIRFGCPKELVSNRGTHFLNSTIKQLTTKYLIKHRKSTPYHLRANGQTEKTNGILCKIITKTVQGSNTDWNARLLDALWAYRCAYKVTTKHTPFQLVYGQEAILPIEIELPSLRIALEERLGVKNP
jgi:hypothetical protein